eukprot:3130419-Prymnesium_polylepis.1
MPTTRRSAINRLPVGCLGTDYRAPPLEPRDGVRTGLGQWLRGVSVGTKLVPPGRTLRKVLCHT